jgi:phospho-N-acetylmuramoyl-pentapeptide-transferase
VNNALSWHMTWPWLLVTIVPWAWVLLTGPSWIGFLRSRAMGQAIREDGPQAHQRKAGTPTGGGILILSGLAMGLGAAWLAGLQSWFTTEMTLVLAITLTLGLAGFWDDWIKVNQKKNKGLHGFAKLAIQGGLGLLLGLYVMLVQDRTTVPLLLWGQIDLGYGYPLFAAFVVAGASNAVNLTDGLDGLAGGTSVCTLLCLFVVFTSLLHPEQAWIYPDFGLICLALATATLGFLWFNRHPAKLFMGDTGSLALGGAMGAMAILSQSELWLGLCGVIFVAEAVSVILQVISFKSTGKRLFRMSPLHHHFELGGMPETRVVRNFIWVQLVLCLLVAWFYRV